MAFIASGNACTTPWSVMAIALCPQSIARWIYFFTGVTPSILLIWVCRCSSTRFSSAVSIRGTGGCPNMIFFAIRLISLEYLSNCTSPCTRRYAPFFNFSVISPSKIVFFTKNFTVVESLKSVISKDTIYLSPLISRDSTLKIFPSIVTFSPTIFVSTILETDPLHSLPNRTPFGKEGVELPVLLLSPPEGTGAVTIWRRSSSVLFSRSFSSRSRSSAEEGVFLNCIKSCCPVSSKIIWLSSSSSFFRAR